MFLRLVSHDIRPAEATAMSSAYRDAVIAQLRHQPGCVFAALFQSIENLKESFSMTIWNSQQEAAAYERSGVFAKLFDTLRPFYQESDELELQLSEDLSIEYTPIQITPNVTGYDDADTEREYIRHLSVTPFAANILTLQVQQEKIQHFQEIFSNDIAKKISEEKGFIHIILLRHETEFKIISFWDETIDLYSMQNKEAMKDFTRTIFDFLSSITQWQVTHHSSRTTFAASESMKSALFRCLVGEWFSK